ncbi:uncharacterized protein RBU57_003308 [Macrochelys suwanniensis]
MPPHARRSPVWSNGEVLDLISVCGEEAVQSQLHSSRRNYDTFGQISRDMMERGHDQDTLQCRVKVKELCNVYRKACEANSCSGGAPATCHFYKELDVILGGDPTSTLRTTMDTSEASSTRQEEEEESGSEGAEEEEDTLESLDACSQELFSSQEEGSQSQRSVLGEGQTPKEVPNATLRSQPSVLSLSERLQRIRKSPRRSKEDVLHEAPQGSILSLVLFNIYIQPLGELVRQHGLKCQQYAGDTQLYQSFTIYDCSTTTKLAQCLDEISSWIKNSWLKLDLSKTEVILVLRGKYLEEFAAMVQFPLIESLHPQLVNLVCNLGILLDSSLTVNSHITMALSKAFYHLQLDGRLCPIVVDEDMASVVHAITTSLLDYSNVIIAGHETISA